MTIDALGFDGEDASAAWLGRDFTRSKPLLWKTSSTGSDPDLRVENWRFHGKNRKKGRVDLYDLATDPGETLNLAEKKTEIVRQLSGKLDAWVASLPKEYDKGDDRKDADVHATDACLGFDCNPSVCDGVPCVASRGRHRCRNRDETIPNGGTRKKGSAEEDRRGY